MSERDKTYFRVIFINQGEICQLCAENIYQSDLFHFVEVETCIFSERSDVVIDPSEEKLKREFGGVRRSYIPITAILRIDEVEQETQSKVLGPAGDGNIIPFPQIPSPSRHRGKKE